MADAWWNASPADRKCPATRRTAGLAGRGYICECTGVAARTPDVGGEEMRILCATDLQPKSDSAVARAGMLSDQLGADLTLLHIVVPGESQQTLEQTLQSAAGEMPLRVRPPRWRAQRAPN